MWVSIRTRPGPGRAARESPRRPGSDALRPTRGRRNAVEASAELNAIDAQATREVGATGERPTPILAEPVRGISSPGLRRVLRVGATLLAAVVALVLLIGCVNVGNLLLARGTLRRREFAVRRALGATKARLLRQLLTESLLLGIGGGICGVILALWTNELVERSLPSLPSIFPVQLELTLDWRVIGFATIISFATTVACGLLPAWRTSQLVQVVNFKGDGRHCPASAPARPGRSSGHVPGASDAFGQRYRSIAAAAGHGSWLHNERSTLRPHLHSESPVHSRNRSRILRAGHRTIEDCAWRCNAAQTSSLPLMPGGSDCVSTAAVPRFSTATGAVDPGYFKTMGIAVISGREFTSEDLPKGSLAVLVNESLARRAWPGGQGLGERLTVGCDTARAAVVVGIVRDTAVRNLGERPQPQLYRPFARRYLRWSHDHSARHHR